MDIINTENKLSVIMGDMNIDLLQCQSHIKTNDYLDNLFSNGFVPEITKPTRITSHSATLIDHIYTNKPDFTFSSGIILTDISDHFGTFLSTSNKLNKFIPVSKIERYYFNALSLRKTLRNLKMI